VSIAGFSTSPAGKLLDIGFDDWASSHESIEATSDVLRLLCYHSSALIPNFSNFYAACESFLSKKAKAEKVTLLRGVVSRLKRRISIEALQTSGLRSFLMLKLLFGYAGEHFSDREREGIFPDNGIAPSTSLFSDFGWNAVEPCRGICFDETPTSTRDAPTRLLSFPLGL
jgi:hypothetical protein